MTVDAERMRANLELTHGALFSQRVLLALVEPGCSRDDAYRIVQELAQRAWDEGIPLRELLAADERGRGLDLDAIFDYAHYMRHAPRDRRAARRDRLSAAPGARGAGPLPLVASRHVTSARRPAPHRQREGPRDVRAGRRRGRGAAAAADGRQRPHLDLRRGPPDADPRQGQGAHGAVGRSGSRRPGRSSPTTSSRRPTACPRRRAAARSSSSACEMLPVECVVRGYITGSGWKDYQATGTVSGIALPAGLRESEQLPEPIFTPSTKAEDGHDEAIDFERGGRARRRPRADGAGPRRLDRAVLVRRRARRASTA